MNVSIVAFQAGPPVCGSAFFGRRDVLTAVTGRITAGSSVLLCGLSRIGKSSILKQIDYMIDNNQFPDFASSIIRVRLNGMLFPVLHNDPEAADEVALEVLHSLVRTLDEQKDPHARIGSRGASSTRNRWQVMEILERVRKSGKSILFVFDEFDDAVRGSDGEAGALMRAIIDSGLAVALACSLLRPEQMALDHPFASPWFSAFHIETVTSFREAESIEMLTVLSGRSGRTFSERECRFLIDVFGNQPFFLQSVGQELFLRHDYSRIEPAKKSTAVKDAVSSIAHSLETHITYLVTHLDTKHLDILRGIAAGKKGKKMPEAARFIPYGLIKDEGGDFEIASGILREYILRVPLDGESKDPAGSRIAGALADLAKSALQTAVSTAIESAATRYL